MTKPEPINNERRRQRILENLEASKPVLAELRQAGITVEWISDLYNKRFDYRSAIPILLNWLPRVENPAVKEAIVRALSVSWARKTEAPVLLVEEFRKAKGKSALNWAIGNGPFIVVADDSVLDDIVDLIRDETYGKAREMLVIALGRMKTPEVKYTLIKLLDDENLAGYAIMALGRLKIQEARPAIERFLTHSKSWVRREAKRALAKIDRMSGKLD